MTNSKRNKKILKGLFVIGLMLFSIVPISAIGGETNFNDSNLTDKISKYLSNGIKLDNNADQNVWTLHPGDSIDETVDKAKDGDTILLDGGDYKTASCTIAKSITLKASGIGGNPIISKRSKGTIITLSGANFKLEGLTINGSNSSNGILIRSNANATINNCNITNTKNSLGGGVYVSNSNVNIFGCNIVDNEVYGDGAGVYIDNYDGKDVYNVSINHCRFYNNKAPNNFDVFVKELNDIDGNSLKDSINLNYNWWGDNNNPYTSNKVNTPVSSWMILNLTANPNPTSLNQPSKLTASLTYDNKGNYHDPQKEGHIPDGITVEFPNEKLGLINGQAQSIFKSPTIGIKNILIKLDNQELSIGVETRDFQQLKDVYVNKNGDNSNSGDQDHPMSTINAALDRLIDGGTIHLLTDLDIDEPIYINKNVTINNNKPGNNLVNENGALAYLNGLGKHQIMGIEDSNVRLNGLYFQNGNATAGGAITSLNSNLTIYKSIFNNNSALIGGALLSLEKNNPNNSSRKSGIPNINTPFDNLIKPSTLHTNEDRTRSFNAKNTLVINSSNFVNNKAFISSAIMSNNQNIYVNDTFFYGNTFNENTTAISFTSNNLNFDETNLIAEELYTNSNKISPYMELNRIDKNGNIINSTLFSYYKPNQKDIDNRNSKGYFTAEYNINDSKPIRLDWKNNVSLGDDLIFNQEVESSYNEIKTPINDILEADKKKYDRDYIIITSVLGTLPTGGGLGLLLKGVHLIWKSYRANGVAQVVNPANGNHVIDENGLNHEHLIDPEEVEGEGAAAEGGGGLNPLPGAVPVAGAGGGNRCGCVMAFLGSGLVLAGAASSTYEGVGGRSETEIDNIYILNEEDIVPDRICYIGETIHIKLDVRLKKSHDGSSKIPNNIYKVQVNGDVYNVSFKDSVGTIDYTIKNTENNLKILIENQIYKKEGNKKYFYFNEEEKNVSVDWHLNPTDTKLTVPDRVEKDKEFELTITTLSRGEPIKDGDYKISLSMVINNHETPTDTTLKFTDGVAKMPYTLTELGRATFSVNFKGNTIYTSSSDSDVVVDVYGSRFPSLGPGPIIRVPLIPKLK